MGPMVNLSAGPTDLEAFEVVSEVLEPEWMLFTRYVLRLCKEIFSMKYMMYICI